MGHVSLEKRNKIFTTSLAKNLASDKKQSYSTYYRRLVLSRRLTEFIVSGFLVFGGQQFLIKSAFFSALWPSGGVALSALYLRGPFVLWGIFAGSLISFLFNDFGIMSFSLSIIFTGFIYLIRKISYIAIGSIIPVPNLKILYQLITIIALLSGCHVFLMILMIDSFTFEKWYFAVLGEINGILYLMPFCLMFDAFVMKDLLSHQKAWWIFALIFISSQLILLFWISNGLVLILLYLIFIILLGFYAYYFGQLPTCITLLGLSVIYLTGIYPLNQNQSAIFFALICMNALVSLSIATYRQQQYYDKLMNL